MKGIFGKLVASCYSVRKMIGTEDVFLRKVLKSHSFEGAKLLDVGCGFANYYDCIIEKGHIYSGVDVNSSTVEWNKSKGRNVFLLDDLILEEASYDVILFSHIIEHFSYKELVEFLNHYLKCLKLGGVLIIFTPLMHRGFFDDFDHVKVYNTSAIRQLFCRTTNQDQGFGLQGKYEELDVWDNATFLL